MAIYAELVRFGTCNGQAVLVDMTLVQSGYTELVRLLFAYTTIAVAGAPTRPGMTGAAPGSSDVPQTIPANAVLRLLAAEAAALNAIGGVQYITTE